MSAEEKLANIYTKIPTFECKGLCQDSCGPIGMSQAEAKIIKDRVGARVNVKGEGRQVFIMKLPELTCPLLNPDGKCSVYADRLLGTTDAGNADEHEQGCHCVIHEARAAIAKATLA